MISKHGFETSKSRSSLMKKIKSKNTRAEVFLRKSLWDKGYRYRKNYKNLPGKPDILFIGKKVAVFIDGEFWHGYNWEEKKKKIKSNREYWIRKIERNMERDKKNTEKLEQLGYTVIRFWEKDVLKNIDECLSKVLEALNKKS